MWEMLPLIAGFFLILFTRTHHESSLRKLTPEQKGRLEGDFWKWRLANLTLLLAALFTALKGGQNPVQIDREFKLFLLGLSALIMILTVALFGRALRSKLSALNLPRDFIRAYMQDRVVQVLILSGLYAKALLDHYRAFFQ